MDKGVRDYLARIGQKGGQKSRRVLSSEDARAMVQLREARRAYQKYHAQCFWSFDPRYQIEQNDIAWVAEGLMKYGNRSAWYKAQSLCP